MSKSGSPIHDTKMIIMVQGREVAMQFTEKPNPQVALQVTDSKRRIPALSSSASAGSLSPSTITVIKS